MTRSRISMVVAAAGLVLVGLLAAVLFTPGKDDQPEPQTAAKDDVKPIERASVSNPLYPSVAPRVDPTPQQPSATVTTTPPPAPTVAAAPAPAKPSVIEHKLQPGEVLSKLAVKYGCKLADIYRINDGIDAGNAHKIRAGTTIRIPVGAQGADVATSAAAPRAADTASSEFYPRRVITGDARDTALSLSIEYYGGIMQMFRKIKAANPDLDLINGLKGGEQVVLPEFGSPPAGSKPAADTIERSSLIPGRK